MSEATQQAVARIDRYFLDVALGHMRDARLSTNPLIQEMHMDIAQQVLAWLRDRIDIRTK